MLGDSNSVKETCVAGKQQARERGRETELTEPSWDCGGSLEWYGGTLGGYHEQRNLAGTSNGTQPSHSVLGTVYRRQKR